MPFLDGPIFERMTIMSEKQQRTAASMRETMLHHYDDTLHHKHDKYHLTYRQHWPSHPVQAVNKIEAEKEINKSTGIIRERNLRKFRKQFAKVCIH